MRYIDDWNRLTERIGFWIDTDDAYVTLDNDYIESVWWSLAGLDQGLLTEGHKVVPYCTRCGTALSSHEVALGYKDVVDPSVYVKFPLLDDPSVSLLAWTTMPWTLVPHAAIAVDPEVTYARARLGDDRLDPGRVAGRAGARRGRRDRGAMPGPALRLRYEPPFPYIGDYGERGHTVLAGDFVSTEDGTGVVHTGAAFGEDDFRLATDNGLTIHNPVRGDGTFDERTGPFAGMHVRDADAPIIEALRESGRLFRAGEYEHSYPHCWRCDTPLIYYAKRNWYVRTTERREELLAANEAISGIRTTSSTGASASGSRTTWTGRSRANATGARRCRSGAADDGEVVCVGLSGRDARARRRRPDDLHRPFIDEITFERDGKMRRVPDLIDVWWDSGCMPFAQWHAPFENEDLFAERFPADYICEALDQTRGWFYSLLAVSTLLFGRASYRDLLCLGLILDPEGQKMSKSKGNVVEPWDVLDTHGADAFRWYYFTTKQPWDGYRFSLETVGESVRQFLKPLWNTYAFYVLYANVNDPLEGDAGEPSSTAGSARGWRARRARDRADGGLRHDLRGEGRRGVRGRPLELVRAPVAPAFLGRRHGRLRRAARLPGDRVEAAGAAHAVRGRRDLRQPRRGEPSVHLCDFPVAGQRDEQLEADMQVVRDAVELGRAARAHAKLKVRQPLREAVVVAADREREAIERLERLLTEELNVKSVRYVSEADELGRFELKPNYRELGPRFGKQMPQVAPRWRRARPGAPAGRRAGGHQHRRPRARDRPGRRDDGAAAARRLPGRALGHARRGAQPGAGRRAAPRGPGPRGRARGAGRAQERRPERGGPHRAHARRRRGAARGRAGASGLRLTRDARHLARLRRWRRCARGHRGPALADRGRLAE